MANKILRLESFPFDSRQSGYDTDGYPVYDRAVGADVFRTCLSRIFTDGVFGTPADALQINKGGSGLTVTVNPGIFIIKGAMGGIPSDSDPVVLTLDESAPQGNTCYSLMLRLDDNEAYRSLYIRVVKGESAANPQPTYPDQTSLNVMEYRLGYVIVPNGATDLGGATIVNEKGFEVCPYTAPFESIDVSDVLKDVDDQARDALSFLLQYFETYRGLLDSAIDGTTAEYLQQQINNLNTLGLVDNVTLGATHDGKMEVKDQGVTTEKIKDGTILPQDLGTYLQYIIGISDTTSWSFEDYDSFIQSMDDSDQSGFIEQNMNADTILGWTADQVIQFDGHLGMSAGNKFFETCFSMANWSWSDISHVANNVRKTSLSAIIGQTKSVSFGTYGNFNLRVVGCGHDNVTDGGKAAMTLITTEPVLTETWPDSMMADSNYNKNYVASGLKNFCDTKLLPQLDTAFTPLVKKCNKTYVTEGNYWPPTYNTPLEYDTVDCYVWLPSVVEVCPQEATSGYMHIEHMFSSGSAPIPADGQLYEYYSQFGAVNQKPGSQKASYILRSYNFNISNAYYYSDEQPISARNFTGVNQGELVAYTVGVCI